MILAFRAMQNLTANIMSALSQKQTFAMQTKDVGFTAKSGMCVTIGVGTEAYLNKMLAEPFARSRSRLSEERR